MSVGAPDGLPGDRRPVSRTAWRAWGTHWYASSSDRRGTYLGEHRRLGSGAKAVSDLLLVVTWPFLGRMVWLLVTAGSAQCCLESWYWGLHGRRGRLSTRRMQHTPKQEIQPDANVRATVSAVMS